MTKQVQKDAAQRASNNSTSQNLYFGVQSFDKEGHDIGFRIVDLYHFGTRKWMEKHTWWALHNGHTLEIIPTTPDQVTAHVAKLAAELVEKYSHTPESGAVAEEPAPKQKVTKAA